MEWAQILVIMLSIILAIFLLLAIVLVALMIKVTRQIRKVTSSAERTASHIESVIAGFGGIASPVFFFGMLKKLIKKVVKR